MNAYINSILIVAVIGGVVSSLVSSNKLRRHINYIIGLISTLILLSPIVSFITNLDSIKETVNNFISNTISNQALNNTNSIIINTGVEKVCEGVKTLVIDKYNFDEKDICIDIITDTTDISSIRITRICITLKNKATWSDAESIEKYVENYVGCDVLVIKK